MFTNAMLATHDITSLIRDTEAHERALFSVPPPTAPATPANPNPPRESGRRQTVFNVAAGEVTTGPSGGVSGARSAGGPRRNTAVAAVLGGDLHAQILKRRGGGAAGGDLDVEVLLHGAEKLCNVYPLPGAPERIPALRQRHAHQGNTLAYYEAKLAEQLPALESMNLDKWMDEAVDDKDHVDGHEDVAEYAMTEDDLRREEEELRELEKKRKDLQQRLRAMEKDLGGLE